jgi:methionyl-tRNA formyltransferase
MFYKKILVITDNATQYVRFKALMEHKKLFGKLEIDYKHSVNETAMHHLPEFMGGHAIVDVNKQLDEILQTYDLAISIHCYQFFPARLVNGIKCINVHPGFNPVNRGWYPQVFAIVNGLEVGATIHEMDEKLDNGNIIDRKKVTINSWDTSLSVYNRVLDAEIELLDANIEKIFDNAYQTIVPESSGNFFSKRSFSSLCQINMDEQVTFKSAIDRLRALSHGEYKNAWYIDKETGKKVFVSINLSVADS